MMGSLLLESIDASVSLEATTSSLEFLLVSFCQHFQLTVKEAAGLLTQGGKYLAHVLAKGLKGSSQPVVAWYQALHEQVPHLAQLIHAEAANGSVQLVLAALKSGFISKHLDTATWCCRVFAALGVALAALQDLTWEWFISDGGGLEGSLLSCRRYGPEVKPLVASLLMIYGRGRFGQLFMTHLRQIFPDPLEYLATVNEFLSELCLNEKAREEIVNSGLLEDWIEFAIQQSEGKVSLQLAAINFLSDLWIYLPEHVVEDRAERILDALRKGHRERSLLMKFACLGKLFQMLVAFTAQRVPYAPTVYKSLTFALVENYEDQHCREFILTNFILVFQSEPSIPVEIIIEPLLKQLQVSPDLELSIVDFDFFNVLAEHPSLTAKPALQLMDILARSTVDQLEFARTAMPPFLSLLSQFSKDPTIQEFIYRFTAYTCKLVTEFATKRLNREALIKLANERELTNNKRLFLQRNSALDLLRRILELKIPRLTSRLVQKVVKTNATLKQKYSKDHSAMLALLQTQGNPQEFLDRYGKGESPQPRKVTRTQDHSAKVLVQPRVLEDIEKAKAKSNLRRAAQAAKTEKELRGRNSRQLLNVKQFERPASAGLIDQTSTDSPRLNLVLKRYSKALRELFKQFSSTGYANRDPSKSAFDSIIDKKRSLSIGEFYRLLKEHGVTPKQLSVEEATALMKEFCHKDRKAVLKVNFKEFVNLLTHAAVFIFAKPPHDLSLLPPEAAVQMLINQFRDCRAAKALPTTVFDEPHPGFGDREVVDRLNRMLQATPHADLPEGFKKVTECEVQVHYRSPPGLPASTAMSLELLDDLLLSLFGVHILEPTLIYSLFTRAKGVLPKVVVQKAEDRNTKLSDQYHLEEVGMVYHRAKYYTTMPAEISLSSSIKYEIARLSGQFSTDYLIQVGTFLEDLVHSVQINSNTLVPKNTKPKIYNKAMERRDQSQQAALAAQHDLERKRRLRLLELEAEMIAGAKAKIAKSQALQRQQKDEQLRTELKELEEAWDAKVKARKAARVKQWKQERAAEFQERMRIAQLQLEEEDAKKKVQLRQFLKREQDKIQQLLARSKLRHSVTPSPQERQASRLRSDSVTRH